MFDIIVLAVIGILTIIGLWKGVVKQLFGLLGVVAGYLLAMRFYQPCSKFLTSIYPGTAKVISFIAIFLASILVAHLIGWGVGRLLAYFKIGIPQQNRRRAPGILERVPHRLGYGDSNNRLSSRRHQPFQKILNHQIYFAHYGRIEESHTRGF